jgi:signal transduction histidine kinase/CheY-like chemotaxis protein
VELQVPLEADWPALVPRDFTASSPEMAVLVAEKDWSTTLVGPREQWSPALRMMVDHVLGNGFGLLLWWGPDYVQFYNDAYRPVLGTKHPRSLGQPASECFSEIWDIIGPMIDRPFHGGPPSVMDDLHLEVDRYGFLEETHFTVAYSPVFDETADGGIGGVVATVHETTEQVIGERRIRLLSELSARAAEAKSDEQACEIAARVLEAYSRDIPFALFYLVGADNAASLVATQGTERCGVVAPQTIDLNMVALADFAQSIAASAAADTIGTAVAVPIPAARLNEYAGVLIAGTSPRLAFTETYRAFFDLVVAPVGTAITNARAYEEERKRAEALAELDRAKNAFFSNVSHEFRTPLTLMLGPLTELAKTVDGKGAPLVDSARRNSLRLLKLVNTLLEFSRIEAGRADASFVRTDLAERTADLCSAFRSTIESAGLEFTVDVETDVFAYVDSDMWEKIVLNLLSNAFKYTMDGAIRVVLTGDANGVELRVEDTGIGIPEEELPHVFERFRRVRSVQGRTYEGSGIGLALTRDLVHLHGGLVDVQSKVGEGSTFRVRIPLGTEHLDAGRIVESPASRSGIAGTVEQYLADVNATIFQPLDTKLESTSASALRPRVMVVDDNWDLREYVSRILAPFYDVDVAAHGVEALQMLRARPYDLVLSDVMMPVMDGLALLQTIRRDKALQAMPVILLSARAGEESSVSGLQLGANDYLVKPFSTEQLLARVRAQIAATSRQATETELQARIARSFQDAALPGELPTIPGIQFSSLYEPALINSRVGGDFYDAFRLLDGRLVVSIGDVAGSGLEAAATMGAVRQSIRAAAMINPDPQLLLKAADGVFLDSGKPPFASAFVAVIDPLTFSMQYANAGHPPALLRRPDGTIAPLVENDLLLGIETDTPNGYRRVSSFIIEPGSLLALYTDGLTEALHDHADGEVRLTQAVAQMQARRENASHTASAIRDTMLGAGGTSHDDVAVLTTFFERPALGSDYAPSWTFAWNDGVAAHRTRAKMGAILAAGGLGLDELFAADTIFFELVGNAVRHARTPIEVALDLTQPSPVLHVFDSGPGFALNPKLPSEVYSERGRGLYIVAQLAREFTAGRRTGRAGTHLRAVLPGIVRGKRIAL